MEKLYEIDALIDEFWYHDLEDIAFRECINNLIGTKSLERRSVDSKRMYARVLLECLLYKDSEDDEVNLEEIFHPEVIKYGYYGYQYKGMIDVLQRSRLEKDYLKDKTSHWDKKKKEGKLDED